MIATPKISIIVPVYNVEKYIHQCLDSITRQTLKEIEIIIVNDCSPFNEDKIIKEFIKKDSRIIYIKNKQNVGLGEARNIGFKTATGEYFGCVDSDDYIAPDMFEKLYLKAKKFDSDLCFCDLVTLDCSKNELQEPHKITDKNMLKLLEKNSIYQEMELFFFQYWTAAYLRIYKKEFYINNISYPCGVKHEDVVPHFTGFLKAKKITFVNEALYFYRINRLGSITNSKLAVDDIILFLKEVKNLFKSENLFEQYKNSLISFYVQVLGWYQFNPQLHNFVVSFLKEQKLSLNDIKKLPYHQKKVKQLLLKKSFLQNILSIQNINIKNIKNIWIKNNNT